MIMPFKVIQPWPLKVGQKLEVQDLNGRTIQFTQLKNGRVRIVQKEALHA